MKKKKISGMIGLLFGGCIAAMGLSGCMSGNELSVDDCLSYLENKYSSEFTYVQNDRTEITASYLKIFVQNAAYPDGNIFVEEELTGDGVKFHDNYVAVKYQQETKALLEEISTGLFGECRVIYTANTSLFQPDEYNDSTAFEEFISQKASKIYASVLLPPEHSDENKEQELKQLAQQCIERNLCCTCDLYYVEDAEAYRNINSNADAMNNMQWHRANGQFTIDNDLTVSSELWR